MNILVVFIPPFLHIHCDGSAVDLGSVSTLGVQFAWTFCRLFLLPILELPAATSAGILSGLFVKGLPEGAGHGYGGDFVPLSKCLQFHVNSPKEIQSTVIRHIYIRPKAIGHA